MTESFHSRPKLDLTLKIDKFLAGGPDPKWLRQIVSKKTKTKGEGRMI